MARIAIFDHNLIEFARAASKVHDLRGVKWKIKQPNDTGKSNREMKNNKER